MLNRPAIGLASPLPLWEGSDCEATRVRGSGLSSDPNPLTPTLSHKGRGTHLGCGRGAAQSQHRLA